MIVNNNKIKGNHGAKEKKKKLDIVVIQRIGHTIILKTRQWTYKMHVFFFKEKRKKKKHAHVQLSPIIKQFLLILTIYMNAMERKKKSD